MKHAIQTFLLDVIDNLPRHRISDFMMKLFIWILKEAGASDVPSFDQLRKMQNRMSKQGQVNAMEFKSAKGHIFHMLDPRLIVANVRCI
jgi:hypothetical protein